MIDYSDEYKEIVAAYEESGGKRNNLLNKNLASLVINGNKVLGANSIPGIKLDVLKRTKNTIKVRVTVKKNSKNLQPIHLCFGMTKEGQQNIISEYILEENSYARILAHCSFPDKGKIGHFMNSEITIAKNAKLFYTETHYHGNAGNVTVKPKANVNIGAGGVYKSNFNLIKGRVGILDIDYEVFLEAKAICELTTKIYAKADDKLNIKEVVHLNGKEARSLVMSRAALTDQSYSKFVGETYGNAPAVRGHIDCTEVLENEAQAVAIPIVNVKDKSAKVTHEAAIGSLDRVQIETLMARGLTRKEATDFIIQGLLRETT